MREQKNDRNTTASLTVAVETTPVYKPFDVPLLAGTVFYILDRDLSEVLKENRGAIWGELLRKSLHFRRAQEGNVSERFCAPPITRANIRRRLF